MSVNYLSFGGGAGVGIFYGSTLNIFNPEGGGGALRQEQNLNDPPRETSKLMTPPPPPSVLSANNLLACSTLGKGVNENEPSKKTPGNQRCAKIQEPMRLQKT